MGTFWLWRHLLPNYYWFVSNLLASPASGDSILNDGNEVVHENGCFQSISFPSEWGLSSCRLVVTVLQLVSNLLASPASGDEHHGCIFNWFTKRVSNLLASPASGDVLTSFLVLPTFSCFQSISFPSEWGQIIPRDKIHYPLSFQSISFPSEWGQRWL